MSDARVPLVVVALVASVGLTACVPFGDDCDGSPGGVAPGAGTGATALDPDASMWAGDAALDPAGDLAVRCDGGLCVWDADTGELSHPVAGALGSDLAFAGEVGVGTSQDGEGRGEVILTDGDDVCVMRGHEVPSDDAAEVISDLAVDPTGDRVVTVAADARVGVWSVTDRRHERWLEPELEQPSSVAVNATASTIAVGGAGGPVELWDLVGGEPTGELDVSLVELAWHPYEQVVAGADPETGEVMVVDAGSSEVLDRLPGGGAVADLAWSSRALDPSSRSPALAIAPVDGTEARVWTPGSGASGDTGSEVLELVGHEHPPASVVWSETGTRLYSVDPVDGVLVTDLDPDGVAGEPRRLETPGRIADS